MKKVLSVVLVIACIAMLMVMPVSAEKTDTLAEAFQSALDYLGKWGRHTYDEDYIVKQVSNRVCGSERQVTLPASEFEAVLDQYFAVDEVMLEKIRNMPDYIEYNETEGTYTAHRFGGTSIDFPADRIYLGYVNNGETYDVFYQHKTLEYLTAKFDSYREFSAYVDELGWPSSIEYEGVVYERYMDIYYNIVSYDNYGKKFTVEYNGGIVRIISCEYYTEEDLPDAFDDAIPEDKVIYDLPENGTVIIPENECFEGNTVVKADELLEGAIHAAVIEAMGDVAEKYVAYEFTATQEGEIVQPNGKLTVTFAIPEGFSDDVSVYYMVPDGTLDELESAVDADARTVTAELEHFSTYIVVDNASAPVSKPEIKPGDPTTNPSTGEHMLTYAWVMLICATVCMGSVMRLRKKEI